jgi:hypothetical protein
MRERMPRLVRATGAVGVCCVVGLATGAWAQGVQPAPVRGARARAAQGLGQAQGRGVGQAGPVGMAELQRLFDAYQIMQAQEALQLDDVLFGQFLPRLKQLQETRRRNERARQELVTELARLTSRPATADEAILRQRLQALQDLEGRAVVEVRRAYDGVDQLLDVRRQARFRVFEQNMERRKFQLMLRARRSDAGRLGADRVP